MIPPTARLLTLLAVLLFATGCSHSGPAAVPSAPATLTLSPNRVVGRILAVDRDRGFAFVDVGADVPAPALADGAALVVRTLDLRETGRLRVSRYMRGRTLGTTIVSGQPSPGDEVVWPAP